MNVATKSSSFLRIPFYSENFRDVAIFDQENGDYFKCDNIEYDIMPAFRLHRRHGFWNSTHELLRVQLKK